MVRFILSICMTCVLVAGIAFAEIPQIISYQGVLTNDGGAPVADDSMTVTFRLYDVAERGAALWEESQEVRVKDGLFSVALGSTNPLDLPFDEPYWLGITVGTEGEVAPRVALTASPYSLNANTEFVEPAEGQSLIVRNTEGEQTHILDQDGDVYHKGKGVFDGGIEVILVDTSAVPIFVKAGLIRETVSRGDSEKNWVHHDESFSTKRATKINAGIVSETEDIPAIYGSSFMLSGISGYSISDVEPAVKGENTIGQGVGGYSEEGIGVYGRSTYSYGMCATSLNSVGLRSEGAEGAALFVGDVCITKPSEESSGHLKIDEVLQDITADRYLVWSSDKIVRYKTPLPSGDCCGWAVGGEDLTTTDNDVDVHGQMSTNSLRIVDEQWHSVISFDKDGSSYQKGLAAFNVGLQVPVEGSVFLEVKPDVGFTLSDLSLEQVIFQVDPQGNVYITKNLEVKDCDVTGTLTKPAGSFKIDHPLDPENKFLYHSFVESPDMMNIYNGNAVLDGDGRAEVELPEWFGALNRDVRYQLTCIGGYAPVYIAEKVTNNRFTIAGGREGLEVSWQVTGIRKDAYAEANRIKVEEEKPLAQRGKYLHPEVFSKPESYRLSHAK